ncbi:hypothetical protein AVEN_209473-1 [Araneus ventricosus]|uniref:Uncharacterized protein n=1 Tax=Araneus ventricosus TaxID=182803 RepID=A0A4Y2HC18_ARAVE|nr:hypothetical protein AVEN_209473-1 [Araneus ventricosus]
MAAAYRHNSGVLGMSEMLRIGNHHTPPGESNLGHSSKILVSSEPQVTRGTISLSLKTSQHSNVESSLIHCSTASSSTFSEQSNNLCRQSDEDLKMFFTFELSPFPLSLFNEEGIRKGTKSSLFSAFTPTKIDAVQAVVFDGYPFDVNRKSTKSAERIRRANLHSSHEIIFNEVTCPEISQEQFLANERNKVCFIDLLKKFLQKANVTVKQAAEDADVLIVETAVSVKSQYDNIFVVGEDIDFLVLLTGLAPMKENLYFRNVEKEGRLMCYTPQRHLNTNSAE